MTLVSKLRFGLSAAACLLSPLVSTAQAQTPEYLTFQVPGSIATYPLSINDSMTVTGYWVSKTGVTHGFVRQASGVITSFDVAGSSYTEPVSINKTGVITGNASPSGFVRAANGTITPIANSYNGITFIPQPVKINDSGEVAGNAFLNSQPNPHQFTVTASGTVLLFENMEGGAYPEVGTGLNNGGAFIAYGGDNMPLGQGGGFLYPAPGPTQNPMTGATNGIGIDVPGSYATMPTSINASGAVAGCYSVNATPPNSSQSPSLTYYDFVYQPSGTLTTLKVPGTVPSCVVSNLYSANPSSAAVTIVPATISINDAGTIVASYTSTANVPSAFMQTSSGAITTFTVPSGTMTLPTGVNNSTDITGYYSQGTTVTGFVRLPSETCCTGSPVQLTVEASGFYWDGGGSQYGRTALQEYQDYPSAGQNWTWSSVPGGFNVCTLGKVCLSDNGSQVVLSAKADVFTITSTGAVLDMSTGEYVQNASSPGNGAYLSTGPVPSVWTFSMDLH